MKYDFTSIIDRRGKDALAVESIGKRVWGNEPAAPKEGFDPIPMWVADMNFPTCPAVPAAIIERAKHPLYGYFRPSDVYYDAILRWQTERNGFCDLEREYIGYENGVHGCVTSAVQTLSSPGDKILLHSPTYVGFAADVEGLGRTSVYSPLKKDANGVWRMDYADMDAKLKANNIHLAIFCSPHNPCGRVWERWELEKAMEVFEANQCLVISDEIWADLTYTGHQHIPTLMVNDWAREHTVAVYAPSKTFNCAGLRGSAVVVPNPELRKLLNERFKMNRSIQQNIFAVPALVAAYTQCEDYLEQLLVYLEKNVDFLRTYLKEKMPKIKLVEPEATYLMWLDCTELGISGDELANFVIQDCKVAVSRGDGFGQEGKNFIRLNIGCPTAVLKQGLDQIYQQYQKRFA